MRLNPFFLVVCRGSQVCSVRHVFYLLLADHENDGNKTILYFQNHYLLHSCQVLIIKMLESRSFLHYFTIFVRVPPYKYMVSGLINAGVSRRMRESWQLCYCTRLFKYNADAFIFPECLDHDPYIFTRLGSARHFSGVAKKWRG